MEQLISTPVKAPELILGKLCRISPSACATWLLAVLMGEFVFHVPLRGNVALLFGMSVIFLIGALAMGMLISIVTKSQLLSSQVADAGHVSAGVSAVGIHVHDRQHAAGDPVGHLPRAGAVLRALLEGHLPERRRAGDSRRPDRPAGGLRRRDGDVGQCEFQKKLE